MQACHTISEINFNFNFNFTFTLHSFTRTSFMMRPDTFQSCT